MQDALCFKEVYLGIFYAFSMKEMNIKDKNEETIIDTEAAKNILNDYADKLAAGSRAAEWEKGAHYAKGFEYAQKFLLDKLPKNLIRLRLIRSCSLDNNTQTPALCITFPKYPQSPIPIDVYLSIFPDSEIGILFFNIKFGSRNDFRTPCPENNDISTDDMIFIIHSLFENRFEVNVRIPCYLKKLGINDGYCKMSDVTEKFVEFILGAFSNSDKPPKYTGQFVKSRILEIRDSGGCLNQENAEYFLNKYPEQIYGLMVGDEGWRFVPKEFSESRIKERWGSRDFMSILSSSAGTILLNFRNTHHYDNYIREQTELRKAQNEEIELYFNFDYCISGMDHGAYFSLEKAVLTKLLLEQQSDQLDTIILRLSKGKKERRYFKFIDLKSQKELQKISDEINKFYANITKISIENEKWELDNVYKNINKSMSIDENLNDIKIRLGDHFDQYYSIVNNQYMSNLNNLGLTIALAGTIVGILLTIIGIFLTIIGLYLSGAQIYSGEPALNISMNLSQNFIDWLNTSLNPFFN